MKHSLLLIAVIFLGYNSLSVQASDGHITQSLIVEKNQQMRDFLVKRDAKETMIFLHSHIAEDAIFEIEVNNLTQPNNAGAQSFEMNKVDYINSFIGGVHYVDNYDVSIDTLDIKISDNRKSAVVSEKMTEEGVMLNMDAPSQAGMPFNTITTCETTYTMNEGLLQSDSAKCKTTVSKTSAI